jgi:hypothetical protein
MSVVISLGIGADGITPFILTGLMVSGDAPIPVAGEGELVLAMTREVYQAGQRISYKALERETYTHPKRNVIKSGSRE